MIVVVFIVIFADEKDKIHHLFTAMYEKIQETASWLKARMTTQPTTAIILGTGLGRLAEEIQVSQSIDYKDIPNFPVSTVEGHSGKFIFGKLGGRHIAWVISRLENLCCVLEYNGLVHPEIDPDSIYINPNNHTACLYSGWWDVTRKNTTGVGGHILSSEDNLNGIRRTADAILDRNVDAPSALIEFIGSRPRIDAYEDFAYWDEVIIRAFGKRRFVKMETEDSDVYGKGDV